MPASIGRILSALALLVLVSIPTHADTLRVRAYNVKAWVPDGGEWRQLPPGSIDESLTLLAGGMTDDRVYALSVHQAEEYSAVSESWLARVVERYLSDGWSLVDSGQTTLGGIPAIEAVLRKRSLDSGYMQILVTLTDEYGYQLNLLHRTTDPRNDSLLSSIARGFGFISPPIFRSRDHATEEVLDKVGNVLLGAMFIMLLVGGIGGYAIYQWRQRVREESEVEHHSTGRS